MTIQFQLNLDMEKIKFKGVSKMAVYNVFLLLLLYHLEQLKKLVINHMYIINYVTMKFDIMMTQYSRNLFIRTSRPDPDLWIDFRQK